MARKDTESWAEHAQHVLAQTKHHTGAARQALLELLDTQACALSAIEIEDALRERERPIGRASIYRILDELERLHLVQKLQVGQDDGPLRADPHRRRPPPPPRLRQLRQDARRGEPDPRNRESD